MNIAKARYVSEIADYIGQISSVERAKYQKLGGPDAEGFDASATFILGGQIKGSPSELYLIYPEGNHITASEQHPYLQIGETKYGKPILDRIIRPETSPETALRCAILSIDSTMRSNATVGPPLECLFYRNDSLEPHELYNTLEESHPYLIAIRQDWDKSIRSAVERLPSFTAGLEDPQ
jgi:putative proteasome-type protease